MVLFKLVLSHKSDFKRGLRGGDGGRVRGGDRGKQRVKLEDGFAVGSQKAGQVVT